MPPTISPAIAPRLRGCVYGLDRRSRRPMSKSCSHGSNGLGTNSVAPPRPLRVVCGSPTEAWSTPRKLETPATPTNEGVKQSPLKALSVSPCPLSFLIDRSLYAESLDFGCPEPARGGYLYRARARGRFLAGHRCRGT